MGKDGLPGEGILHGGNDDALVATTVGAREDIEVDMRRINAAQVQARRGGGAGAGLDCLRVRVGRRAALADGLPAPAGMWGEDAMIGSFTRCLTRRC